MDLPLQVVQGHDCWHVIDNRGDFIAERMMSATDAQYLADAVNEYVYVREAKLQALTDFKRALWAMNLGEQDMVHQELSKRIEALK